MKSAQETAEFLRIAKRYFDAGFLTQADIVSRYVLSGSPENGPANFMVGLIAERLSRVDIARDAFEKASRIDGVREAADAGLRRVQEMSSSDPLPSGAYHLVVPWQHGFWSDVDHVLGQMLFAEIAGRTPVVYWGGASRYNDTPGEDAFSSYFEPVSQIDARVLLRESTSLYPSEWTESDLYKPTQLPMHRWTGDCGLELMARPEKVVVSDHMFRIHDILPWLPRSHPDFGQPIDAVYRRLIETWLKPTAAITAAVENFAANHIEPRRPVLALHFRGTDKYKEIGTFVADRLPVYLAKADAHLRSDPRASLLIMTDDERFLGQCESRYGDRIIFQRCRRSDGRIGLHFLDLPDKTKLGFEIMIDTYAATRCDSFLGIGVSNVSAFVNLLRAWPDGTCTLIGRNFLFDRNLIYSDRFNLCKIRGRPEHQGPGNLLAPKPDERMTGQELNHKTAPADRSISGTIRHRRKGAKSSPGGP